LPGEVRGDSLRDDRTERRVIHASERRAHLGGDLARRRNGTRDSALRRALQGSDGANEEAKLTREDAALAQPGTHLVAEKRELVRPDAGGYAEHEDAAPQRQRPRAIGDSRADGLAPQRAGDGRLDPREPIFTGPIEDLVERLGRPERRSAG